MSLVKRSEQQILSKSHVDENGKQVWQSRDGNKFIISSSRDKYIDWNIEIDVIEKTGQLIQMGGGLLGRFKALTSGTKGVFPLPHNVAMGMSNKLPLWMSDNRLNVENLLPTYKSSGDVLIATDEAGVYDLIKTWPFFGWYMGLIAYILEERAEQLIGLQMAMRRAVREVMDAAQHDGVESESLFDQYFGIAVVWARNSSTGRKAKNDFIEMYNDKECPNIGKGDIHWQAVTELFIKGTDFKLPINDRLQYVALKYLCLWRGQDYWEACKKKIEIIDGEQREIKTSFGVFTRNVTKGPEFFGKYSNLMAWIKEWLPKYYPILQTVEQTLIKLEIEIYSKSWATGGSFKLNKTLDEFPSTRRQMNGAEQVYRDFPNIDKEYIKICDACMCEYCSGLPANRILRPNNSESCLAKKFWILVEWLCISYFNFKLGASHAAHMSFKSAFGEASRATKSLLTGKVKMVECLFMIGAGIGLSEPDLDETSNNSIKVNEIIGVTGQGLTYLVCDALTVRNTHLPLVTEHFGLLEDAYCNNGWFVSNAQGFQYDKWLQTNLSPWPSEKIEPDNKITGIVKVSGFGNGFYSLYRSVRCPGAWQLPSALITWNSFMSNEENGTETVKLCSVCKAKNIGKNGRLAHVEIGQGLLFNLNSSLAQIAVAGLYINVPAKVVFQKNKELADIYKTKIKKNQMLVIIAND